MNKSIFSVLFLFIPHLLFSQNTCSTNANGDWDDNAVWTCDTGVDNPPDDIWNNGSYINIDHDIKIPNNTTIDLSTSSILEIRLNGNLTFGSNGKLILPSGAKIIFAPGATVSTKSNSGGTLIEIGENGVWGRGCTDCSNGTLTGPGTIDENSDPNSPLPVELINFESKTVVNTIVLYWSTASEINNDFFTLEKSKNGHGFVEIGKVVGNGTVNTKSYYSLNDNSPYLGLSYYRLSQTDIDGTTEVFPMISIVYNNKTASFTISPNPISNQTVKFKVSGKAKNELLELNIIDLQGKLVEHKYFKTDDYGIVDTEFQLKKQLQKDTYIFELVSQNSREYLKVAGK